MEYAIPKFLCAHFVQRQPRVFKCHAICVNGLAVATQNHDCLWNKVNNSPQLLFVGKEFGLSRLSVTSTGRGCKFLECGTKGRCGVPLTTLLLHIDLSAVWRHRGPPVHCSEISIEGQRIRTGRRRPDFTKGTTAVTGLDGILVAMQSYYPSIPRQASSLLSIPDLTRHLQRRKPI